MRLSETIGIAACFSLLIVQASGLHVHADEHGYIAVPETPYSHSHSRDHDGANHHDESGVAHAGENGSAPDHDYDDARDVSLLDLALSTFKSTLAILAFALLFGIFPRIGTLVGNNFVYSILSGRHTRWRPPLRAPPLLASL